MTNPLLRTPDRSVIFARMSFILSVGVIILAAATSRIIFTGYAVAIIPAPVHVGMLIGGLYAGIASFILGRRHGVVAGRWLAICGLILSILASAASIYGLVRFMPYANVGKQFSGDWTNTTPDGSITTNIELTPGGQFRFTSSNAAGIYSDYSGTWTIGHSRAGNKVLALNAQTFAVGDKTRITNPVVLEIASVSENEIQFSAIHEPVVFRRKN